MRLVKLHRAIRYKSSFYVASYIENNTAKRQLYNHDDVMKSLSKLMTNAFYVNMIENVARLIENWLLNVMEKAQRLPEKPHSVDYCVIDN